MIVVSVTLHSASDGSKRELARMEIFNDETGGPALRNYGGRTFRGRDGAALDKRAVQHTGEVKRWPSDRLHVWFLVAAMLRTMGYMKRGSE